MSGEGFDVTISGLLRKRSEMMGEAQMLREQLATVMNDMASIDRVLEAFGYRGDLEALPVAKAKLIFFHKSELQQHLLYELKGADKALSSRELAIKLVSAEGKDSYDRRLLLDVIKRVSKALGTLKRRGIISGGRDEKRRYVWKVAVRTQHRESL